MALTILAASSMTCSQLSKISNTFLALRNARIVSSSVRSGASRIPNDAATTAVTSVGSSIVERSTKMAAVPVTSPNAVAARKAVCVFPMPAAPVSVKSRRSWSSDAISRISASRPIKLDNGSGKFPGEPSSHESLAMRRRPAARHLRVRGAVRSSTRAPNSGARASRAAACGGIHARGRRSHWRSFGRARPTPLAKALPRADNAEAAFQRAESLKPEPLPSLCTPAFAGTREHPHAAPAIPHVFCVCCEGRLSTLCR